MTESRVYRMLPLTLALLTLVAFLPALRNDFVNWDDPINFLDNPDFRGLGWPQLHWMWTSHLLNRYIPITWMTLGLDYSIWGMDPFGYHVTSLLWHVANVLIFYWLAIALFRRAIPENSVELRERIPWGAFFAALIFALHPLRVESVAWITERRDLVSGLFYLLAIIVYVRGVRDTPGRPIERRHYWGCLGLFVLGILSKEMVVTLPVVLLILDVYPLGRLGGGKGRWLSAEVRGVWLEKLPFFLIGIADSALAFYVGLSDQSAESFSHIGFIHRITISIYGLAFYVWKTILPYHLSPMHALTLHRMDPRGLPFQISAVVVVWIAAAALILRRRFPAIAAVALAYGVTLIPVLGFFHNGHQITADRYSYLPCLGWALLAGGALLKLWSVAGSAGKPLMLALVAVCGGLLGFLTWQQTQVWRDSETLWRYCLAIDPSSIAFNNIGGMMAQQGDIVGATDYFRQAAELDPGNGEARNNYGNALLHLQDWENAAREFEAAKQILPDLANAHWGLGSARLAEGRLDEAIAELRESLRLEPNNPDTRRKLDEALAMKK